MFLLLSSNENSLYTFKPKFGLSLIKTQSFVGLVVGRTIESFIRERYLSVDTNLRENYCNIIAQFILKDYI